MTQAHLKPLANHARRIQDSDTRVPVDCLLDAVSEMEQSPDVGIMQFASGVMNVTDSFFENGITFFTNLIYTAIKYTVSNGDVAPFVGHNAILRWSAIQEIGYFDEDGYEKFWSESHVSEDFEMSLKLQCNGYIIRLAAWDNAGFKEGVSLTVYDELARWEKYAYGCNELLFHPIRTWLWKGYVDHLPTNANLTDQYETDHSRPSSANSSSQTSDSPPRSPSSPTSEHTTPSVQPGS